MTERVSDQKLIITIVQKDKAKKVIHQTRLSGARGGTTIPAEGIRLNEKRRFLGIPVSREREVIFTVVDEAILDEVIEKIEMHAKLGKHSPGIAVVIDVKRVLGMTYLSGSEIADCSRREGEEIMKETVKYDLIVTIVNAGEAEDVVESTKKRGADGGTIIHGRGTGVHEQAKLFNILIEPEKDIVLTLINSEKTNEVLEGLKVDCHLNKPGKGIAFVLDTERTIGINHIFTQALKDKYNEQD